MIIVARVREEADYKPPPSPKVTYVNINLEILAGVLIAPPPTIMLYLQALGSPWRFFVTPTYFKLFIIRIHFIEKKTKLLLIRLGLSIKARNLMECEHPAFY